MLDKNALSEEALQAVSGGKKLVDNEKNRKAFGEAWKKAGMEGKGYSGIQRGEYYEAWLDSDVSNPAIFLNEKPARV